jgi:selenocysteine lyase/cysteine desulfurase
VAVAVPVPGLGLLSYRVPEGVPMPPKGARVLTPLGNRSSIVSFATDPAREPAKHFAAAGVEVSVRDAGRQVRVSPALFNTADDIDRFLESVKPLV